MPELRQNIITGDWVVIAPERAKRPQDFIVPTSQVNTNKDNCPFCEGTVGYKSNQKIRSASTENFYVIENKFPAFVESEDKASVRSFYPEKGFYRARAAIGDHEVVISKHHDLNLMTFSKTMMMEMFEIFCARYDAIKKDKSIVSIMPIYNHGVEAGASVSHPHAQIFASGIIANTVGRELSGAEKYYGINGSCVFCDIIDHERHEKVRIVEENADYLATTFYASRFPLETWVYPKRHDSQFENTPKKELKNLADIMHNVLQRLERNIPRMPLNFYIHTLPTIHDKSNSYHWHLEIVPRLANYGGYEIGSGVIIDVLSPEAAAEYLRKGGSSGRG